jgi:hypothetical protein
MYFFFSGEGATDLGVGARPIRYCVGEDYLYGPLTIIADQVYEDGKGFPFLVYELAIFVASEELERIKPELRSPQRSPGLRGMKTPPEMRRHRKDAQALMHASAEYIKHQPEKEFVVVLFRDYDSDHNTDWQGKRQSMINGFKDEFDKNCLFLDASVKAKGIPAVANPVSEAWWLRAIYRNEDKTKDCRHLEETVHGDKADHALKIELEGKLETTPSRDVLNEMVINRKIDYKLIDSESFQCFLFDFREAVGLGYLNSDNPV